MGKNGTAWVSLEEQETVIRIGRTEDVSLICTSDTTMKTKYDKLVKNNPKHWKCTEENEIFSFYECRPKSLISARSKTTERVFTDEQKKAMAERLAASREKMLQR